MWFACLKTLALTAVQVLLSADSAMAVERPELEKSRSSIATRDDIDAPITEYEIHYGISRRGHSSGSGT